MGMTLLDVIKPEQVFAGLSARSKDELLGQLAQQAGSALGLEAEPILQALLHRESLGSTGVGAGIAIPHAPVTGVGTPFGIVARLRKPVAFAAIDGVPVDIVCLLLTPPEARGCDLRVLAAIARRLRDPAVVAAIRAATDTDAIYRVMTGS